MADPPEPSPKAQSPVPAPAPAAAPTASTAAPKRHAFDEAQSTLCLDALKHLRIGVSQALLYSADSKQFGKASENTLAALDGLLNALGGFKLGIAGSEVLINGLRLEVPAALRGGVESLEKVMADTGCGGLKFEKGVDAAELGIFLQLMARKKLPRGDGAKVNQLIREQGVTHIQVDELRYVAVSKGQMVVSGTARAQAVHMAAQKAMTELVDAVLGVINNVEDEEAKRRLRADLADQLIEKSDPMLANLLGASSERLKPTPSAEHVALAALPSRDGVLLNHALHMGSLMVRKTRGAGTAPEGSGQGGAGSPAGVGAAGSGGTGSGAGQRLQEPPGVAPGLAPVADDELSSVRQIVEQLVDPYKSRPEEILGQMQVEEDSVGLLPEWLLRAYTSLQSRSPQERLQGMLQQSPAVLLNDKMYPQVSGVMDELAAARLGAEAGQLGAHVTGSLHAPTKRERAKAVQRLSELVERPQAEQVPEAVNAIEDELMDTCAHETTDDVMKLLLEHLTRRCVHHYKGGNYARVHEHLDWVAGLEESARLAMREDEDNLARQAIQQLAKTDVVPGLAEDILDAGDKGRAARRLAQLLGSEVWSTVLQRLRAETDPVKAETLARALRELGKEAVDLFLNALAQEADGATALKLLDLSHLVADAEEVWGLLPKLLCHADKALSAKAIGLAVQHDGQAALDVLCAAARESTDAGRRKLFVQAAAQLHDQALQPKLLRLLETDIGSGQLENQNNLFYLECLSAAGNRGIVHVLSKAMSTRGRTLVLAASGGLHLPKAFALTAIKALGPFYHDPAVAEILDRLRKDKDQDIARLALVGFRGLLVSEHAKAPETAPAQESPSHTPAGHERDVRGTTGVPPVPASAASVAADRKSRFLFAAFPPSSPVSAPTSGGSAGGFSSPERAETGVTKAHATPAPQASAAPGPPAADPRSSGLTPSAEGHLQELGLVPALRMLTAKDGYMEVVSLGGRGGIYVVGGKVLNAAYTESDGLVRDGAAALAAISALQKADFAYFPGVAPPKVTLNLEVEKIEEGLRRYRESRTRRMTF